MKKIQIWAGSDLLAIVEIPHGPHQSDRVFLARVISEAKETWGDGVQIKKVSECRYEVDVSACGA